MSLPHSARVVTFLNPDTACFAYSSTEYAIFSISTTSAVDVVTPLPVTFSKGTLTGLTGYMTLGLGAKAKPAVVQAGKLVEIWKNTREIEVKERLRQQRKELQARLDSLGEPDEESSTDDLEKRT